MSRVARTFLIACNLALAFPTLAPAQQGNPVPAGALVNAQLLRRLERLEAELRDVRTSKDKEVEGLKSQVSRLEGELEGMRFRPVPQPPPILLFDPADLGEAADQGPSKSGNGGSSGDGYSGGAGSGTISTSG